MLPIKLLFCGVAVIPIHHLISIIAKFFLRDFRHSLYLLVSQRSDLWLCLDYGTAIECSIQIFLSARCGKASIGILIPSNAPVHTDDAMMIEFVRCCLIISPHPLSPLPSSNNTLTRQLFFQNLPPGVNNFLITDNFANGFCRYCHRFCCFFTNINNSPTVSIKRC